MNRSRRSALRTKLRACNELFLHGSADQAEKAYRDAAKALDREADRGLIHRNAAARHKSRLARRLNALRANAVADA